MDGKNQLIDNIELMEAGKLCADNHSAKSNSPTNEKKEDDTEEEEEVDDVGGVQAVDDQAVGEVADNHSAKSNSPTNEKKEEDAEQEQEQEQEQDVDDVGGAQAVDDLADNHGSLVGVEGDSAIVRPTVSDEESGDGGHVEVDAVVAAGADLPPHGELHGYGSPTFGIVPLLFVAHQSPEIMLDRYRRGMTFLFPTIRAMNDYERNFGRAVLGIIHDTYTTRAIDESFVLSGVFWGAIGEQIAMKKKYKLYTDVLWDKMNNLKTEVDEIFSNNQGRDYNEELSWYAITNYIGRKSF